MEPITLSAILAITLGGIFASHHYLASENKADLELAKKNVSVIERTIEDYSVKDRNWIDKKGVDLLVGNDSKKFYPAVLPAVQKGKYDNIFAVYHYPDGNNSEVSALVRPVDENHMFVVVSSKVNNSEYFTLFPYEKISVAEQIPNLYAKKGIFRNITFSTYAYDGLNKIRGCLTRPSVLIDNTVNSQIRPQDLKFKIPQVPCSDNAQNISAAYEYKPLISNVNLYNKIFLSKGANIINSNIEEVIAGKNHVTIDETSYVQKLDSDIDYSFPVPIKEVKKNSVSNHADLVGYQFTKECGFGEILHIGNGVLQTLHIKKGCSSVVLEGNDYEIGSIVVDTGTVSQIKFSKNTTLKTDKLIIQPQAKLYLTAFKNSDAHIDIIANTIKLGREMNVFMGKTIEQKNGKANLECVHAGTCLYDANEIKVIENSTLVGEIIARNSLYVDNSELIGNIFANSIQVNNSVLSNIVKSDGSQIISKRYIDFFISSMGETLRPFLKVRKPIECNSEKECEKTALRGGFFE